jgi:hypothetical protein
LGLAEAKRNLGIGTLPFAADVFLPGCGVSAGLWLLRGKTNPLQ